MTRGLNYPAFIVIVRTMTVRIYGQAFDEPGDSEVELRAVHMDTDSETLRALADFLLQAANRMDQYGDRFNREAYESDAVQLVVSRRYIAAD
jgi:hypothetical protein